MKKILSFLLVFTFTLALVSCDGKWQPTPTNPNDSTVHEHTIVIDKVVDATCSSTGLTEGKHCSSCGEIILAQTVIEAKDHTPVVDPAVAPTYTTTGLTEGSHCDICNTVLIKQEVIAALEQKEYSITYVLSGGTLNTDLYSYNTDVGVSEEDMPTPTKTGYTFAGWYTTAHYGEESIVRDIPDGTKVNYRLYAKWNLANYKITYKEVPQNTNSTSYNIEDKLMLNNPTWTGLIFTHWTDQNGNSYFPNDKITSFPKKMTGDLILTANWKVNRNIATPADGGAKLYHSYDGEDGFVYFFYDLGTIEHVVLDDLENTNTKNIAYKSGDTSVKLIQSSTVTIGEEIAGSVSKTVSRSVSSGTTWEDTTNWASTNTQYYNSHLGGGAEIGSGEGGILSQVVGLSAKLSVEAAFDWGQEGSETDGWTHSKGGYDDETTTNEKNITTSLAYREEMSTTNTTEYEIKGEMPDGYYAYVHAGNIRVIAVVSYETATGCFYLNTYSRLDNIHSTVMYYEDSNQMNNPTTETLDFTIPEEEILGFINSSYYVDYDLNGGTGTIPSTIHTVNEDGYLTNDVCTKDGYIFMGWNTSPDGMGEYLESGAVIKDLASAINTVSLYAIWASDGLEYTLNEDNSSYSVTGIGTCTDIDIIIPNIYNELPVTRIGHSAFKNKLSIESIIIPDSVTSIGNYAFCDCSSLTSVVIGDSVTIIGDSAFCNCSSLTSVTIPDFVTNIGNYAFNNCSSLTSVTIGDSVTSIDDWTFSGCTSLTNVTIGNSVTRISSAAFSNLSRLQYNVYDNAKYLGNEDNPYLLLFSDTDASITSCEIHSDTKVINARAFMYCKSLTSVVIGDSVTIIGASAFSECTSLTSITIPDSVTNIGNSAFSGCTSLKSVTIGNSLTNIGDSAFDSCRSIKDVYYTGDIEGWLKINFSANYSTPMHFSPNLYFNGKLVTDITIPDTVTSICDYAFYLCHSLESITIPDSVTNIGDFAFSGCTSLTSVTIPDSVTGIGSYAFRGCSSLTSITIPDSVTEIGHYAFGGCSSLTSITIPDSVTYIGNYAFYNCSPLTSVMIGDSVTSIGQGAFYGCSSLTSITIPDSVTSIRSCSFEECYSLIEVYNKSSLNITVGSSNYGYIGYYAKHIITDESESALKYVGDYIFYDDGSEVYLVKYIGNDTEITLPEYECGKEYGIWQYAFYNCSSLTSVTIGDSVTSIGNYAFYNCSSLTSVTIGDSVMSIGEYAFKYCIKLTSVTIGDSVTKIGDYAFFSCSSLTRVTLGNSVTSIGGAFQYCYSLIEVCNKSSLNITTGSYYNSFGDVGYYAKHIITDESESYLKYIGDYIFYDDGTNVYLVKYIGNDTEITLPEYEAGREYGIWQYAFYEYSKLTSVTIPDSVTNIHSHAFCYCDSLTSVTIPDSVTKIGDYAFYYCDSLESVTIGDSVMSIGEYAFKDCIKLTSVTIGDSVTKIGDFAFYDCNALENIVFEGSVEQWNAITKVWVWNSSVPATEVICSDGTVPLS